jgi:hypothetical protein
MTTQTTHQSNEEHEAYEKGMSDGYYNSTFAYPSIYTLEQVTAYTNGYKYGKTIPAFWRSEQEASDNATRSAASGKGENN